jgi:hypothetical protein
MVATFNGLRCFACSNVSTEQGRPTLEDSSREFGDIGGLKKLTLHHTIHYVSYSYQKDQCAKLPNEFW